jgi:predicted ArsR family transcriptional regulator
VTSLDARRGEEQARLDPAGGAAGQAEGGAGEADGGPGGAEDAAAPPPLSDDDFSAAVTAVTSAFGDPTRRRIYLRVREHDEGVTASEVAAHFDLHANVARHHLDKLSAGGYLTVFVPRPGGGGAGRPSKRYRASAHGAVLTPPPRGNDLLIVLLGRALALLPPETAEAMAEQVGEDYGRRLAGEMSCGDGQRSSRVALHAIADALTAHGFEAHAEARGGSLALIKESCPFFDTAKQHPVICAVDRGMVRGMLAGLSGGTVSAEAGSSRALGDEVCVTFV